MQERDRVDLMIHGLTQLSCETTKTQGGLGSMGTIVHQEGAGMGGSAHCREPYTPPRICKINLRSLSEEGRLALLTQSGHHSEGILDELQSLLLLGLDQLLVAEHLLGQLT